MISSFDDTIVAIATPPGIGGIAVIRLSGKNSFSIIEKLFAGKKLSEQASHTLHFGKIIFEKNVIDEVVAAIYKNPKSYTGEDVIEINCHGSTFIQEQILQAIIQSGARLASPGEFTQRAFLNGKLDLSQAEAVADLIAAQSQGAHQLALQQLRGGYSDDMKMLRERLIWFAALIELELDFSQEDVEFADRTQLQNLIAEIKTKLQALISSFALGNVLKNGVATAIVGKPNAGKSTLLNALLKENRAIVSAIAGTTRDTIEEVININGIIFRLIDTAGIRTTDDSIEKMGVEKSYEKIQQAQVVVYLYDVNELNNEGLMAELATLPTTSAKIILVGNKIDEADKSFSATKDFGYQIFISAKNELHIDELKMLLFDTVSQYNLQTEGTIVSNQRHLESLQNTLTAMQEVEDGANNNLSGDLLAAHIRQSLYHLGTITGAVTNDDLLDTIFKKFCIGK